MAGNQRQGRGGREGQSSSKKRKAEASATSYHNNNNKRPRNDTPRQNTAIYVTGLPSDVAVEEVHDIFARKCGVIAEEIDSGKPRIKLYADSEGNPKGDALIVFFKPQSVEMAIMLLDDTTLRFGEEGPSMKIEAADSSYKKTQYVEEAAAAENTPGPDQDGDAKMDAAAAAASTTSTNQEKKVRTVKEKQKIRQKAEKLQNKLADWDDEPNAAVKKESSRWDKTVILKHMFTIKELDDDPTAILDIKEDIREECGKLGDVKNVVLFDLEAEGIVSVKFAEVESADACVHLMDGRSFGGQVVEATIATGGERYKKSKKKVESESDSDA